VGQQIQPGRICQLSGHKGSKNRSKGSNSEFSGSGPVDGDDGDDDEDEGDDGVDRSKSQLKSSVNSNC